MMLLGFISFTERLHIFASPSAFQILKKIYYVLCAKIFYLPFYIESLSRILGFV